MERFINHITCRIIDCDEFNQSSHETVFTSDFCPVSTENRNDAIIELKSSLVFGLPPGFNDIDKLGDDRCPWTSFMINTSFN